MIQDLKRRLRGLSRGRLLTGLVLGVMACLILGLVIKASFFPPEPPRLEETSIPTMGESEIMRTVQFPPIGAPGGQDRSTDSTETEDEEDDREEQTKNLLRLKTEQAYIDKIGEVPGAPSTLSTEEAKFVVQQMEKANVDPKDVVFDLETHRQERITATKFKQREPRAHIPVRENAVQAVATKLPAPSVQRWSRKKAAAFPETTRLEARLLTDVVATGNDRQTKAVIEVFGQSGMSLGYALVDVRQNRQKEVIDLEGSRIVNPRGQSIEGPFKATRLGGAIGLRGRSKTHWLRHMGVTLWKTSLGVLSLNLANHENRIAGIIGAQTGTQIMQDLNQSAGSEIEHTTFLPRGYTFQILFTAPAGYDSSFGNDQASHLNTDSHAQGYLNKEKERAILELGQDLKRLESQRTGNNHALSFKNTLRRPNLIQDLEVDP